MTRRRRFACAALWFAASGCVTSTFVLTDGRYAGRPPTEPPVFIDRLPPFPYISIGVIEVSAPPASDLTTVLTEAASKGGEVGCDVVVDRSIHRIASMIPNAGPLVAQAGYAPAPVYAPAPTPLYIPPPRKREFICGLRVGPTPAPAARIPAPAPAPPAPAPAPPATAPAPRPVPPPAPAPAAAPPAPPAPHLN